MRSIKVELDARSACDCFRVATTSLELAKRSEEHWEVEHHSVTGITFTAFSLEAMFNHYGQIFFKDWNEQRGCRTDSHRRLFKAVNLPGYLGSKEYQIAKKCFEIRDFLAHGKTKNESLVIELPDHSDSQSIFNHMISLGSKPFRFASYELLEQFIETTRKIEMDIENNGFYPHQTHIEATFREKLCECPLSVSGARSW